MQASIFVLSMAGAQQFEIIDLCSGIVVLQIKMIKIVLRGLLSTFMDEIEVGRFWMGRGGPQKTIAT